MNNYIHKGDDTGSFGNNFIKIDLHNPRELIISKVIFKVGSIVKEFKNPKFPLIVNFNKEDTSKLKLVGNVGYLIAYDEQNRQRTCNGSITFNLKQGVI